MCLRSNGLRGTVAFPVVFSSLVKRKRSLSQKKGTCMDALLQRVASPSQQQMGMSASSPIANSSGNERQQDANSRATPLNTKRTPRDASPSTPQQHSDSTTKMFGGSFGSGSWTLYTLPMRLTAALNQKRWTESQRRDLMKVMEAARELRARLDAQNENNWSHLTEAAASQSLSLVARSGGRNDIDGAEKKPQRRSPRRHEFSRCGEPDDLGGVKTGGDKLLLERAILQRGTVRSDLFLPPPHASVTLALLMKHHKIPLPYVKRIATEAAPGGGDGFMRLLEDIVLLTSSEVFPSDAGGKLLGSADPAMQRALSDKPPLGITAGARQSTPRQPDRERATPSGVPEKNSAGRKKQKPVVVRWDDGAASDEDLLTVEELDSLALAFGVGGGATPPRTPTPRASDTDAQRVAFPRTPSRKSDSPTMPLKTPVSPLRSFVHYENVAVFAPVGQSPHIPRGSSPLTTASVSKHDVIGMTPARTVDHLPSESAAATAGWNSASPLLSPISVDTRHFPAHNTAHAQRHCRHRGCHEALPRQRSVISHATSMLTEARERLLPDRLYPHVLPGACDVARSVPRLRQRPNPVIVAAAEELASVMENRSRMQRRLRSRNLLAAVPQDVCLDRPLIAAANSGGGVVSKEPILVGSSYAPLPLEERKRCDAAWTYNEDYWFLEEESTQQQALRDAQERLLGTAKPPQPLTFDNRRASSIQIQLAHSGEVNPLLSDDDDVEWTVSGPILRSDAEQKTAFIQRQKEAAHQRALEISRRLQSTGLASPLGIHTPNRRPVCGSPPLQLQDRPAAVHLSAGAGDPNRSPSRHLSPKVQKRTVELSAPRRAPTIDPLKGLSAFEEYQHLRVRAQDEADAAARAARRVSIPVFLNMQAFS